MSSKTTYYILMAFILAGVIALFALITMEMDKHSKASEEMMEQKRKSMEQAPDSAVQKPVYIDSASGQIKI